MNKNSNVLTIWFDENIESKENEIYIDMLKQNFSNFHNIETLFFSSIDNIREKNCFNFKKYKKIIVLTSGSLKIIVFNYFSKIANFYKMLIFCYNENKHKDFLNKNSEKIYSIQTDFVKIINDLNTLYENNNYFIKNNIVFEKYSEGDGFVNFKNIENKLNYEQKSEIIERNKNMPISYYLCQDEKDIYKNINRDIIEFDLNNIENLKQKIIEEIKNLSYENPDKDIIQIINKEDLIKNVDLLTDEISIKNSLSELILYGLKLYSSDTGFYKIFNKILGVKPILFSKFTFSAFLISLNYFPKETELFTNANKVYRCCTIKFNKDGFSCNNSFLSTTIDKNIAINWIKKLQSDDKNKGISQKYYLVIINLINQIDSTCPFMSFIRIDSFSIYPKELEILFLPYCQFKVIRKTFIKEGNYTEIELVQLKNNFSNFALNLFALQKNVFYNEKYNLRNIEMLNCFEKENINKNGWIYYFLCNNYQKINENRDLCLKFLDKGILAVTDEKYFYLKYYLLFKKSEIYFDLLNKNPQNKEFEEFFYKFQKEAIEILNEIKKKGVNSQINYDLEIYKVNILLATMKFLIKKEIDFAYNIYIELISSINSNKQCDLYICGIVYFYLFRIETDFNKKKEHINKCLEIYSKFYIENHEKIGRVLYDKGIFLMQNRDTFNRNSRFKKIINFFKSKNDLDQEIFNIFEKAKVVFTGSNMKNELSKTLFKQGYLKYLIGKESKNKGVLLEAVDLLSTIILENDQDNLKYLCKCFRLLYLITNEEYFNDNYKEYLELYKCYSFDSFDGNYYLAKNYFKVYYDCMEAIFYLNKIIGNIKNFIEKSEEEILKVFKLKHKILIKWGGFELNTQNINNIFNYFSKEKIDNLICLLNDLENEVILIKFK